MKIGLFDLDSKYHNLALMKLSAYYKFKGHEVEFYQPLFYSTYDRMFCSKIFTKTCNNDNYITPDMVHGGSGFLFSDPEYFERKLPKEIEHLMPDYSLYNLNYSLGFTTRGCIRNCGFCIVRQKEGYIKEHAEVEEFLNPKSNIVVLLDNNFLALPSHIKKLQKYIKKGWKMDFNQGLDIRLINEENAELLAKIKLYKQLRFSWDFIKSEKEVKRGLELIIKFGIKPYKIMVFILCGYNTSFEEDMYRFNELWNFGVYPFVMKYNQKKSDKKLNDFARWVNKRVHKVCKWKDYKK